MSRLLFASALVCLCTFWLPSASQQTAPAGSSTQVREHRVPVGGAELYAREVGSGTAIIILHGGPDFDQSYLLPEMDRFADFYRLIYYDQRGRGRSAEHVRPEDVTLASDIDDLDKVRQYFHLESVVLLGHSWGTVLALEYAIQHPERVSQLILMNPAPASTADFSELKREWAVKRHDDVERKKAIASTPEYINGDPEAVTAYYRVHFKTALAKPEDYEKMVARFHSSFTKEGVLKARAVEAHLMTETYSLPSFDLLPQFKSLRIPTLVITGDHEFIPASTAEHITNSIPGARMITLKLCGHFSYLESPAEVRAAVNSFLPSPQKTIRHRGD
jgi:proline iminopeptidase